MQFDKLLCGEYQGGTEQEARVGLVEEDSAGPGLWLGDRVSGDSLRQGTGGGGI